MDSKKGEADSRPQTPGPVIDASDDPIRMYLKEIGQVALLEPDQEIWLSTQMAAGDYLDDLAGSLGEEEPGDVGASDALLGVCDHTLTWWRKTETICRELAVARVAGEQPILPQNIPGRRSVGPERGMEPACHRRI
jgi:hypothetical protein